jgi:hypothetical protein
MPEMESMLRYRWIVSCLGALAMIGAVAANTTAAPASGPSPSGNRFLYRVHHATYGAIGTYANSIAKAGDATTVTTEGHIRVAILGIVMYRQDFARTERWQGDRLMDFRGLTTVNGRAMEVTGMAEGDHFAVMSPSGDVDAPADIRLANPWSPNILKGDTILTPDRGLIENVQLMGGEETSVTINGKTMRTRHYEISRTDGRKRYEIWWDEHGTPVQFVVYNNTGMVTFTLAA